MNSHILNWRILRSKIGLRVLLLILACSSISTLILTTGQLTLDYNKNVGKIEIILDNIEKGYLESISEAVWTLDERLLNIQLDGLAELPNVEYIEITDTENSSTIRKNSDIDEIGFPLERTFVLKYGDETIETIGTLKVIADKSDVYAELINSALYIFLAHAIKSLVVSSFILYVLFKHIVHRIVRFNEYSNKLINASEENGNVNDKAENDIQLLERKYDDELTELIKSVELMKEKLFANIELQRQMTRLNSASYLEEEDTLGSDGKVSSIKQSYFQRSRRVFGSLSSDEYQLIERRADKEKRSIWGQIWEESCAYREGVSTAIDNYAKQLGNMTQELRSIKDKVEQLASNWGTEHQKQTSLTLVSNDVLKVEAQDQLKRLELLISKYDRFVSLSPGQSQNENKARLVK